MNEENDNILNEDAKLNGGVCIIMDDGELRLILLEEVSPALQDIDPADKEGFRAELEKVGPYAWASLSPATAMRVAYGMMTACIECDPVASAGALMDSLASKQLDLSGLLDKHKKEEDESEEGEIGKIDFGVRKDGCVYLGVPSTSFCVDSKGARDIAEKIIRCADEADKYLEEKKPEEQAVEDK